MAMLDGDWHAVLLEWATLEINTIHKKAFLHFPTMSHYTVFIKTIRIPVMVCIVIWNQMELFYYYCYRLVLLHFFKMSFI